LPKPHWRVERLVARRVWGLCAEGVGGASSRWSISMTQKPLWPELGRVLSPLMCQSISAEEYFGEPLSEIVDEYMRQPPRVRMYIKKWLLKTYEAHCESDERLESALMDDVGLQDMDLPERFPTRRLFLELIKRTAE
jgi:hypothetical protein